MTTIYVIDKKHPCFKEVQFAVDARKKRYDVRDRWTMDHLKIETDCLVATDGHQLHVVFCAHGLMPGLYEVDQRRNRITLMRDCSDKLDFLDWRNIVPEMKKNTIYNPRTFSCRILHAVSKLGQLEHGINGKYLATLDKVDGDDVEWVFYVRGPGMLILAKYENVGSVFLAVIAPLDPDLFREIKDYEVEEDERKKLRKLLGM